MDERRTVMLRYLESEDARAAARTELRRRGLDLLDPADLVHDVAVRVLRADLPDDLANPVAYVRRAITFRAADVLRGERVRRDLAAPSPADHGGDHGGGAPGDTLVDVADPDAVDPAVEAATAAIEDGLRRTLHLRLAVARTKIWAVAAALTTLTLRVHRDVAVPADAPLPDGGSPAQADRWVALWLAGEHAVFPDAAAGRADDPARRKARSRRLQEVDDLLRDVALAVLGGADRG